MASQAIVVGINDYQHHPERALNYAVNDAQQMGDFLTQQAGFEQVFLCLGDQAHRTSPTYPTCSRLLDLLQNQLDPNRLSQKIDRLWFYFSGHGVSQNGRDYLITSDCLEDKIDRFGLPIDEVIALLRRHKDTDIVLILDACRQVLGKKSFEAAIGEQTLATAKERGITTIFSCDYGQYSYELEALQQGAFTHALIDGLAKHTLPIQLEAYLRQQVQVLNSQYQKQPVTQIPKIQIDSVSKTFQSLLPHKTTSADLTVLRAQATEAELEEDFTTALQLWWQVIEASPARELLLKARTAIERINRKMAQTASSQPATTSTPARFPTEAELIQILSDPDAKSQATNPNPDSPAPTPPSTEIPLHSEKGIDYTKLRDLLQQAAQADQSELWKAADRETYEVMIRAVGKKRWEWFTSEELLNFPCADLKTIDGLWVKYSQGRFGFSVQKRIYVECGARLDGKYPGNAVWQKFGARVGWRKDDSWLNYSDQDDSWLDYSDLQVTLSSPEGIFPLGVFVVCGWVGVVGFLFSRTETCKL